MKNDSFLLHDESFELFGHRFLQDNSTNTTLTTSNDGQVLKDTMKVYGSIFAVAFFLFCGLRRKYPKAFNIRTWVEDLQCELAKDAAAYGLISWLWQVRIPTDDEIREQCGMDALCFLRMLHFGFKVCLVGMFNSLYLFPTYYSVTSDSQFASQDDVVSKLSISYLPPGSLRFVAPVVASYLVFGCTMYLILEEFKWFTANRHAWLSEREPRNYAVYVSGIPGHLRSSDKLLKYFQNCFSDNSVLEANVALIIPLLDKKVSKREAMVLKLEHLINIEQIKGKTPMRRNLADPMAPPEDAIAATTEELYELNAEIARDITDIEHIHKTEVDDMEQADANSFNGGYSVQHSLRGGGYSVQSTLPSGIDNAIALLGTGGGSVVVGDMGSLVPSDGTVVVDGTETWLANGGESSAMRPIETASMTDEGSNTNLLGSSHRSLSTTQRGVAGGVKDISSRGRNLVRGAVSGAFTMVKGTEDGNPRAAGFISFKKLSTRQAALQMLHHATPFCMDVTEAPDPENIFWKNVGKTNKEKQVGTLLSFSLTVLLCFFWTIPVSFIASLTSVEALSETVPLLADWIEKAPWLGNFLATLAPLLLIAVNSLLPTVLAFFSSLEGPVSEGVLSASTFSKLAAFAIIQTFFVSAISGSIMQELSNIANNPTEVVNLLASSLPGQSTYFLQILLVQTFIGLSTEILRVSPLVIAFVRKAIGPNLTEKERSSTYMGFFSPLNDPPDFSHPEVASINVLYFFVFFVYTAMAPLVNWFLAFCFILLGSFYRYQFFCNYTTKPDSGGRMWLSFMTIVQVATIVAQLTLFGFLALKQVALAIPLLVPLLIINLLFNWYIGQKHRYVVSFLPSADCMQIDRKNYAEGLEDLSFLIDEYKQDALKAREEVLPENLSVQREIEFGNTRYLTPPGSEADMEEIQDSDALLH